MMITTLLLAFTFSAWQAQQTPRALAWDYVNAALLSAAVNRFEVRYDAGQWTTVGIPTDRTPTPDGLSTTYQTAVPALTLGPHTVALRACNVDLCGDATPELAFTVTIKPDTPANLRFTGGG